MFALNECIYFWTYYNNIFPLLLNKHKAEINTHGQENKQKYLE